MSEKIIIHEAPLEEAVAIGKEVPEMENFYSVEHCKGRMKDANQLILIAKCDDDPAGFVIGYDKFEDGSFYCWLAGVKKQHRRKGVLKALMEECETWSRVHGYTSLKIKTRNYLREMLSYLVKHGYHFTEVNAKEKLEDHRVNVEKKL